MLDKKDILVEIPDDDLVELAEMYKKHVEWAPQVYSFIRTGIRWKESQTHRHLITYMSPNNCWKTDGTIIVLMEFFCYDLFVFTFDKKCENLYNGLMNTSRIDWKRRIFAFNVHSDHIPTLFKVFENKKLEISANFPARNFSVSIKEAKNFVVDCPPEVYIKKLVPSDAVQINSVWPHRSPGSERYLATLIEMNGGVGLFLKSTDELVAWVLVHCLGILGILQTEEKHKKKGYGSLITKVLSKQMAEEGVTPLGSVVESNEASKSMFLKAGFRSIGTATYTILNDPKK